MEILNPYNLIIEASAIIILSFIFSELAKKTNVPSVLMLILLGIMLKFGLDTMGLKQPEFFSVLEILGIVGLIMIVLEAALELKLERDKLLPIATALVIALIGLLASTWVAALILHRFIDGMPMEKAWLYATPLSILSSAIVIPSVSGLTLKKREFHIYESTFSDIFGIMLFYFLTSGFEAKEETNGVEAFFISLGLTIAISILASYLIVFVFSRIRSQVKLFLLIAVLMLLYALGKQMHLSSLIIILFFGLLISNMSLFFRGRLGRLLNMKEAENIYENLHIITMESSFVVRTFFFVIFGLTISLATLLSAQVALVSGLIILSIYVIRFVILRLFLGPDILPQLFVAPRGLITILLFYAIPAEGQVEGFEPGILLFIIISTSLIMTFAMVYDKRRSNQAIRKAQSVAVGYAKWKAPAVKTGEEVEGDKSNNRP